MATHRDAMAHRTGARSIQHRRAGALVIIGLVALYVATAAVTIQLRDGAPRPLYDGFTPRSSYRFVDPPPFYRPGNVAPIALEMTIPLRAEGSAAAGIATSDGQFVVSLARNAIAARAGARRVAVRVTPLAPAELSPLPDGLRANGNAYRITMTYEPSGGPVDVLDAPGTLLLTVPEIGNHVFVSSTGADWSRVSSRAVPPTQLGLATTFSSNGYYLAGTELAELAAPEGASSSTGAVVLGVAVAAVAVALAAAAWFVARRRRARGERADDSNSAPIAR